MTPLSLGEIDVDLATDGPGLANVKFRGFPLRDPRRPAFAEFRTPDGFLLRPVGSPDATRSEDGWSLSWAIEADCERLMEFQLHEVRQRRNLRDWTEKAAPVEGRIFLDLRPAERTFRDVRWTGFAYRYRLRCPDHPIYHILDYGTWEPGAQTAGLEFWMRSGTAPSVMKFTNPDDRYATGWVLPTIEQPHIFQFLPLQTALQGFTFTTGTQGALVTWPCEIAHVRSYFEKQKQKDCLFHWHEHCGDLSSEFDSSWMEVLWLPCALETEWEKANLYETVRETVWQDLNRMAGIRQETIGPYGVMEEWDLPDFTPYTEIGLPLMAEAGIRTVMVPSECQNNMNEFGVSNMCCQIDLKISESVGRDKFRRFVAEAGRRGMGVEMWGNTALSSLDYYFANRNGPKNRIDFLPFEGSVLDKLSEDRQVFIRNASGAIEADHYAPVFLCLNLRNERVRRYWRESWQSLKTDYGLSGIFIDSSFNLSSDKFHWRQNRHPERFGGTTTTEPESTFQSELSENRFEADIQTQYYAYLDLVREMQEIGYTVSTEDLGVFGISRTGPSAEIRMREPFLWVDTYCPYDPPEDDSETIFFKGLAYKIVWILYWNPARKVLSWHYDGELGPWEPTARQIDLLKAFGQVSGEMFGRTILAGGRGVVYDGTGASVVWTFDSVNWETGADSRCRDVLGEKETVGRHFDLKPYRVYRVEAV